MVETVNKVFSNIRKFIQEEGREPDVVELAKAMDIQESKLKEILTIAKIPISLETKIGRDDNSSTLMDTIPDKDSDKYREDIENADIADKLRKHFKELSPREEKMIKMKFGLSD
jgi:RNA polymerase primary sigma factor